MEPEPMFQIVEPEKPVLPAKKVTVRPKGAPKSSTVSGTGGSARKTVQAKLAEVEDAEEEFAFGSEPLSAAPLVEKPERLSEPEAKSGPPSLNEWQDFFGRFVIKLLVDGYLSLVLRDLIDELTPAEAKQIQLSKEDMQDLASPLASMSNKSRFMKKHGRGIIALADSYESVLTLLMWMRRVNRISKRHRKMKQPQTMNVQPVRTQDGDGNEVADGYNSGQVNGVDLPGFSVFNPGSG